MRAGRQGCLQAPNAISFHFLSVVSAARVLGDSLRFALLGGRGQGPLSVQRSGKQTGTLLLGTPISWKATLFVSAFDLWVWPMGAEPPPKADQSNVRRNAGSIPADP